MAQTPPVPFIQSDVSLSLFEFLHMEIVSDLQQRMNREVTVKTLERLGYRVGEALIERVAKDVPRFKSELEAIVFMCKQFWVHTFNKPMDNLKTNHQDTYVLYDNDFRLLTHISHGSQYNEEGRTYLAFACGLLQGALENAGIKCQVTAEVTQMPACIFQVKVQL